MEQELPMHLRLCPRCGAKTRSGKPCRSPAMPNGRCRIHGGKAGAPKGSRNALKHGFYSAEAVSNRRKVRGMLRAARALVTQARNDSRVWDSVRGQELEGIGMGFRSGSTRSIAATQSWIAPRAAQRASTRRAQSLTPSEWSPRAAGVACF